MEKGSTKKIMNDFLGNELKVGDSVIIVKYNQGSSQSLYKGNIIEIKHGRIAYVGDWYKGVTSQNIYKI